MLNISSQTGASTTGAGWVDQPYWFQDSWWESIHLIADVAIWAGCLAIPLVLLHFVRRRRDFPFQGVLYLFAGLVLAFGLTHLLEASQSYWQASHPLAALKLGTALAAWATVAALFPLVPKMLALRSPEEAEREVARRTAELSEMASRLKREIAAREVVNRELRESREMLQMALAAGETGSFNWDLQTNEVVFDQAQTRLTGLGLTDNPIHPEEFFCRIADGYREDVRQAVQRSIDGDERYESRFPFTKPDETEVWLAGHGCVIRDSEGRPIRLIGLNQDVTELVQREAELDETAKEAVNASRHKSRFIAQVSHEIRTPLTAMLGCIDTLMPELPDGSTRQTLRTVRSQGEMLRILLNDVLDLSKIEAGKLTIHKEPTSVPAVLASVCSLMEPLAHEKGLELRRQPESALPSRFYGDPYRLRQILLNLVGNAIKFTRTGVVTIVSRASPHPGRRSGTLTIEVRDTGIGIDKGSLARIFREFEQVEDEEAGTGLGLTICSRLVSMMGGELSARSEVGIGSAFTVTLPMEDVETCRLVAADEIVSAGVGAPINSHQLHYPLRILAAEDTPAIQFVLRRMVGKLVSKLQIVDNGREAVEAVMAAEPTQQPFDLVMMDIQMPEVSGIEATRQLRREGFKRPVIALTAGTMDEERRECMAAGCTHFLSKPIDVARLHELLASLTPETSPP